MEKDFLSLREKYKEFIYKAYEIKENENNIEISFEFEIPGFATFNPKTIIQKKNINFKSVENSYIKYIAFNLGMVELISYWKCVCPKNVIIKCGYLDEYQVEWFKKLYYYGLGEYRYINKISVTKDEMMNIIVEGKKENIDVPSINARGAIIPVGGGKDSTVTLELLKQYKDENYCLIIGSKEPSMKCAEVAGYENDRIIEISRVIDENIRKINAEGYLNGHTPFSAMLAFLSYLVATLTNKKYIALSNESSANESNIEGENINHQYSKSYEFEQDFNEFVNRYFSKDIKYFSMLRPINELQIAMLFSQNEKYYKIFRSCNVGSKQTPWNWCCNCPKCLFVYCILSPFLYKENLVDIFGEDLFEKEELLDVFLDLCGYGKNKPFECVGTYNEINFAITKLILKLEAKDIKLPYMLKYYKENYKLADTSNDLTKQYCEENNLPEECANILRKKIEEAIC